MASTPSSPGGELTGTQLVDAVRRQIEYYFSKENLQSDSYLTSQMDANMSVPITVVMKVTHNFFSFFIPFFTLNPCLYLPYLSSISYMLSFTTLHTYCNLLNIQFAKLKALTEDISIVRQALESSTVTLVDDRIRANIKGGNRSTIILRDIPSTASEEEVREIFNFDGCKPITSMRSDIENTW